MITCKYHPEAKATHLFKAHYPKFVVEVKRGSVTPDNEQNLANRNYAHSVNLFLCEDCVNNETKGKERYIRIYQATTETMLEKYKFMFCLYEWEGVYIFAKYGNAFYEVEQIGDN